MKNYQIEQSNNLEGFTLNNIGYVGVDTITIGNLKISNMLDEFSFSWGNDGSIYCINELGDTWINGKKLEIGYSKKAFWIKLEGCFKLYYMISAVRDIETNTTIQLFSNWDRNYNLFVMKKDDIVLYLEKAIAIIEEYCHLAITYPSTELTVTKVELSLTVPSQHCFSDFSRIFDLLEFSQHNHKRGRISKSKSASYSNHEDGKKSEETRYILKGKSLDVIAYAKDIDLNEDDDAGVEINCNLLRFEIDHQRTANLLCVLSKKTQNDRCLFLHDFLDNYGFVQIYFFDYFKKRFEIMDNFLAEQLMFFEPQNNNMVGMLLNQSLSHLAKIGQVELLVEAIINSFLEKEKEYGHPFLLDLEDLIYRCFDKSFLSPFLENQLKLAVTHLFNMDFNKSVIYQRELYEELRHILTGTAPTEYTLVIREKGDLYRKDFIFWPFSDYRNKVIASDSGNIWEQKNIYYHLLLHNEGIYSSKLHIYTPDEKESLLKRLDEEEQKVKKTQKLVEEVETLELIEKVTHPAEHCYHSL